MNPSAPSVDDDNPRQPGAVGKLPSTTGGDTTEQSNAPKSGGSVASPFTSPSVQLPKGGGGIKSIGEKFSVSPATGTGNFSVPIKTSPGRGGSSVDLSLSYNSGGGNGSFGLGWQLSSQSIVRKTDKGLPQYHDEDESDVFLLAGAEDLVPTQEVMPDGSLRTNSELRKVRGKLFSVARYQPRIDNGALRILKFSDSDTGACHWEVTTAANITTIFGDSEESRVFDPHRPLRVFEWFPTRSYDDKGNETVYEYKAEDSSCINTESLSEQQRSLIDRSAARYLKRIKYGNTIPSMSSNFEQTNQWLFEVVFDYGEHNLEYPSVYEFQKWHARPDPFSSRRAGFEVRMYRLCRRVLMFHHFPDEPTIGNDCLVSSFNLAHETIGLDERTGLAVASIVKSVTQEHWQKSGATHKTYKKQFMPPIDFRYSAAQPARHSKALESSSLANLPAGFTGDYQLVDLEGQGLPGVVYSVDGNLLYAQNLANGNFGRAEPLPNSPGAGLRTTARQWMDLDGGGKLDLVQMTAPTPGFFKRNWDEDSGWNSFRTFESFPNLDMNDKNLKFIDLTGDGIADIVIIDDTELKFYPGLGDAGFGGPSFTPSPLDDETLTTSRLLFWDGSEGIYTADMTGDGLADLVRVRNSEICYWPNLGYGNFGAKVSMASPPVFDRPDLFSQTFLLLGDIDGSGTTDIVYLGADVPMMYHNLSGNGWSGGIPITGFPAVDSTTNVRVADLLGRGTGCLVWSSTLPGDFGRQIRYLDLMEAGKPYLLVGVDNNLGWETRITYESSCQFYARDKRAGRPWTAHLPFPVQCVERSELVDRVSRSLFTTKYAYHDGYFDAFEREFRGFGMVESWDTEVYSNLQQDDNMSNINKQSNVPPVLTKTWYHTGEYLDAQLVTRYSDVPYWTGDGQIQSYASLSDPVLPSSIITKKLEIPYTLNSQERRESCRALKGQMLRAETYAIDGTEMQGFPYTVQEANMHLELRQPVGGNRHAVTFVRSKEAYELAYDRKRFRVGSSMQFDPRISHTMSLETDFYGNELASMVVPYGRRYPDHDKRLHDEDRKAQLRSHAVLSKTSFTNSIETEATYLLPHPAEAQSYEIINIDSCRRNSRGGAKQAVLFDDALQITRRLASGAFDIPFENFIGPYPSNSTIYRRLLKDGHSIYRRDDLTGPLPLGVVESLGLPWKNFQLSLTDYQAQHYVESGKIPSDQLNRVLEEECNLTRVSGKTGWWAPSGNAFYAVNRDASAAQELEQAKQHFFTIRRSRPQYDRENSHSESFFDYDKYDLLLQEVRDPYGNRVTSGERNLDPLQPLVRSGLDYRLLVPFLVMDSNRNRSQVLFDIIGNVVASAAIGKPEENLGDSLEGVKAVLDENEIEAFFSDPTGLSNSYLVKATTRTIYDFFAYSRTRCQKQPQPNWVASLARETHESDLPENTQSRVFTTMAYSDGLGRGIQTKAQCEPGPLTANVGSTAPVDLASQLIAQKRWLTSSWIIFNNKNKPIRAYEPFFSGTHEFQDRAIFGVSSITLYDAVGRPVAALSPDHTWTKVNHGPWGTESWDKIDTVAIEDPATDEDVGPFFRLLPRTDYMPTWYAQRSNSQLGPLEKDAAVQSVAFANTPSSVVFDSLGRACASFEVLRSRRPRSVDEILRQPSYLDVQGLPAKIVDTLGRETTRNIYTSGGWVMSETHMDNGTKWTLPDVTGKPVMTWIARKQRFRTEYDRSRRIIGLHILQEGKESLVETSVYGETRPDLAQYNANGRIILAHDQSGVTKTPNYDFQGNLAQSTRQLTFDYKGTLDWSSPETPRLQNREFVEILSYDALGKPTKTTLPDGTITVYRYNERGMIQKVETNVADAATVDGVIDDIEYDAKGQRCRIKQANGVQTVISYDKNTFRARRIQTIRERNRSRRGSGSRSCSGSESESNPKGRPRRPSHRRHTEQEHIQDLSYVFDALGNITHVSDQASPDIFFRNQRIEASQTFTYDSLCRLIEATGREHIGQMHMTKERQMSAHATPGGDGRVDHPNDGKAMGRYVYKYSYDAVNNIQTVHHENVTDGQSYTRRYFYKEKSLVDPNQTNNRLSSTSVGNAIETYTYEAEPGNMVSKPGLPHMTFAYNERMVESVQTHGKDSKAGERIYYRYDATGKRVRKVIERQSASEEPMVIKETVYIGGAFEALIKYKGGNPLEVSLEVHSLRIMESGRQLLLIENRTKGGDSRAPGLLYRYQLGNFQGSATVEVDKEGRIISYEEYTPYGVSSVSTVYREIEVPKRYRFLGKERDETGLYHFGARYYDPILGRFISADPSGSVDGSNLYQYAHGNPVMLADPGGTNANVPPEFAGWSFKDILARANDRLLWEELKAFKGGGALIQQYRLLGRDAAGTFGHFLQQEALAGNPAAQAMIKFETYLPNAKTGGKLGSSFIDFILENKAWEHKLMDLSKYTEDGSLVLDKLKNASARIIVQLDKHTRNLAQLGSEFGQVRLGVTVREVGSATAQGLADFTGEMSTIMQKAGQIEPLIMTAADAPIVASASRLESATMAVIESMGGLASKLGTGAKFLGPLGVGIGVLMLPGQAQAATATGKGASGTTRLQGKLDVAANVTGIGVFAVGVKATAITAAGGATLATGAAVIVAGAAAGGAAVGAMTGGYVADKVEHSEWAQEKLGPKGAELAGYGTGVLAGAAAGAAVGALVGSVLPVVGTAAGAIIGGAAGALGAEAKILISKFWN